MPRDDADRIAKASAALLNHYKLPMTPEMMLWGAFLTATVGFYGQRFYALHAYRQLASAAPAADTPRNGHATAAGFDFEPASQIAH